jgi:carotenoid cleavage dioxygenase-like enzyme
MTTGRSPENSDALPFHLRGNYAPVTRERTELDLPVEGAIPPELRGTFLRNGPNPKSGTSRHWFLGDGMIHGVRLEAGRAAWYRNRWVRTRILEEGAEWIDEDGHVDHSVGLANTHVIEHASRIFALVESSFPTQLTPELDTVGTFDFQGRLDTAMTAHPKICPITGELHFFGYGFAPPYLTYHRADASGRLVQSEVIDGAGPSMMHDFAITESRVVFMDLPIVFSPEQVEQGRFPYEWSDDYGARLGVMPRGGRGGDVRWFEVQPCYVFHPLNAFDDGDRVVMDVARYPELWRGSAERFGPAYLHRWTIDLAAGKVDEQGLDDRAVEFPRVDDRRTGLRHRYGYAVGSAVNVADSPTALVKYDLATGASEIHDFGPNRSAAEGVFAPAGAGEEEGWILAFVYDAASDASELVILDASAFAGPPAAVIRLPQRVPFGFHGSWIAD